MNTEMMHDVSVKREGFTPPFQLTKNQNTDAISVCYSTHLKLLCAEWIQIVDSENLRHAIRLLARTAAVLRAELLLIAMPSPFQVSEADAQWIEEFMRAALRHSPLKKIARVITGLSVGEQPQGIKYQPSSLQCAYFETIPDAQKWLLGDRIGELTEEGRQRIPLQFNLGHIRNLMPQTANIVTGPKQETIRPRPQAQVQALDFCTEFVSISIDHGKQLMRISWKKPPLSRQYRYGMLKACRALVELNLSKMLLNNQRMGVLTLEDQGWLVTMAQKMLPKSNLQKLAVVTSANALQQLSSENIGKRLQEASLKHLAHYFLSEEEAIDWLLSD
jgi:hypothetical protein